MKVLDEYENSHHYWKDYEKTDLYCPSCGKKEVWAEQGEGDYYLGSDYVCIGCGDSHNLDNTGMDANKKIVEQLSTGVTHIPTTRPGR